MINIVYKMSNLVRLLAGMTLLGKNYAFFAADVTSNKLNCYTRLVDVLLSWAWKYNLSCHSKTLSRQETRKLRTTIQEQKISICQTFLLWARVLSQEKIWSIMD